MRLQITVKCKHFSHIRPSLKNLVGQINRKLCKVKTEGIPSALQAQNIEGDMSGKIL